MADRILKPDTGNDLVLQNNAGTAKIEINDGQEITITIGSSSGDDLNIGSGKLLVEGDTSLVSITGDIKVGGNNIEDSGGVVALTFDGSGNTNLSDKILQRPTIKDYSETGNAIGNTVADQPIDITDGNVITATLNVATTTFTFSNPSASGSCCSFTLILTQDGSGSRAVTWPGAVQWASATAPTLSSGAADVDIFAFITVDAGTNWFGFTAGLDMDI
jgi:molybdopterin-binding protein